MTLLQLDLFGWKQAETDPSRLISSVEITVHDLAESLIRYFGDWIGNRQNLLEDDWTVCETLIGIHKRYTRAQLIAAYQTDVWYAAWERFNQFYLTHRVRGDAFGLKWCHANK